MLQRSRADLRGWLERHGVGWIDEPSNDDPRYDRVKARKALTHLAPLGIDAQTLAKAARRMSSARDTLKLAAGYVAGQTSRIDRGDVVVSRPVIGGIHGDEIGRRLMIAALRFVAGPGYPPREASLQRVRDAILHRKPTTLAGCRITVEEDEIRFTREYRTVRDLTTPTTTLWDGRWRLTGPHDDALTIRALGAEGLRTCPDWRAAGLPRASLLATPAIWDGMRLVAAPLAGRCENWIAELAEPRNSLSHFLLSH
jgi:tRNA(Ile)-lysidine synthase